MKKVLVLGVSAVQMDALKLLKELGYETYACAMAKDGPGADVSDHFEMIDIFDVDRLVDYIKINQIDAVYSVGSDLAMPIASLLSERLDLPRFVSSEVAGHCNNKVMMRTKLGKNCEENIPFQVMEDEESLPELGMPYIMKPADAQGQRGIVLVNSMADYKDNFGFVKSFSRSGQVIVEKYIHGPEISVNAYLVHGEVRFIMPSDRETWENFTGLIKKHVVPSKWLKGLEPSYLKSIIGDACSRMGIENGPVYFQIKIENDKCYIIEMTPRLDGCHMWKLLKYYSGLNLLKLTFDHLINQDSSELDFERPGEDDYVLEFFCQEPGTLMNQENFDIPEDAVENFFYYQSGDRIRSVNGKFDKVGYFIKQVPRGE